MGLSANLKVVENISRQTNKDSNTLNVLDKNLDIEVTRVERPMDVSISTSELVRVKPVVPMNGFFDNTLIRPDLEVLQSVNDCNDELKKVQFELPEDVGWIKVNFEMNGFNRVNYDENGWSEIIHQLKNDHTNKFERFRTKKVTLAEALSLASYLAKEEKKEPWNIFLENYWLIDQMSTNSNKTSFKGAIKTLITPLLTKLGITLEGDSETISLRILMTDLACNLSMHEFIDWIKELSKQANNRSLKLSLSFDATRLLHGNAVKYGGEYEWNYFMSIVSANDTTGFQKVNAINDLSNSQNLTKILNKNIKPFDKTANWNAIHVAK
ncbi:hypothetical protein HELRODRAFT_177649 [Helobdella robusta]|uniref:ERAP1-like C-terminal domain-containing protein n=1 Tax=Helobdella robusta TaxID=6412 RepID=T1FC05_HELRO|nr:hypothetical protein HELRODRAFT_177649 [Helobdella robusta]ESN97978.1 hypothetical protein HELRODRAFT_177649 [Helobdella robusta]